MHHKSFYRIYLLIICLYYDFQNNFVFYCYFCSMIHKTITNSYLFFWNQKIRYCSMCSSQEVSYQSRLAYNNSRVNYRFLRIELSGKNIDLRLKNSFCTFLNIFTILKYPSILKIFVNFNMSIKIETFIRSK
jgi:hypothetical protein